MQRGPSRGVRTPNHCVAPAATKILHDASADSDIKLMSRSTLQRLMRRDKASLHNHQVKNMQEWHDDAPADIFKRPLQPFSQ